MNELNDDVSEILLTFTAKEVDSLRRESYGLFKSVCSMT